MPRIDKAPNFFKKNYFNLFGITWFLFGGAAAIFAPEILLGYLYMFMGAGYFVVGYVKRKNIPAYIEWNEGHLILSDWFEKDTIYPLSTIDNLIFSGENLTIKSGIANGTMMDLKGFKEEDIQFFKEDCQNLISQPSGAVIV